MRVLIFKLGATGDVVRTTPLLRRLGMDVVWVTEKKNIVLLDGISEDLRVVPWSDSALVPSRNYDLIINLEDTLEVAGLAAQFKHERWFGAFAKSDGTLCYTDDSASWFDLSLISRHGREEADRLKLLNRRTYQDLIFTGLGWKFAGEKYLLPNPVHTGLSGDVAIAAEAGPVWPMKNWAFYEEAKMELEKRGLVVNYLPKRPALLQHLGDVAGHTCLLGGDSLPMHFALGTGRRCVSLFTCTSPWEIYDYSLQTKFVSPLIGEFFYKRGFEKRATSVFDVQEVVEAVCEAVDTAKGGNEREKRSIATAPTIAEQ